MGSVSINPAVRPTVAAKPVTAAPQDVEAPAAAVEATPEAQPAEEAAPAPAVKQGRGLFGHFADVFIGGGQAIWDMATGVGMLIAHPIQTIKGLGYAITHPAALFHAFVDPYAQAIAQGRPGLALGRGIVEIGSFFITGGSGGAATGSAKGAATATNAATKAGKAAAGVSKAGKTAGSVANAAARAGKVPVMTKAAAAATKAAGVSTKTANAALKAAQIAYWEARGAGKAATVAKAAAAAKAAKIMGLTKSATAVEKIANAARLAGAAADASKWFTRTNYVTRPLVKGAKLVGRPVDAAIVAGTKISTVLPARLGGAVSRLGAITLKQLALAPITVPMAALKGVGNILSKGLGVVKVGDVIAAPGRIVGGAAAAAGKIGSLSIGQIVGGAFRLPGTIARAALANPASLIKPAAMVGMANRVGQGALAQVAGPQAKPGADLSDEQAAAIAEKYGLEPSKENVAAFVAEVQSYAGNTIGPDTGEPEQVKQLQTVLRAYGYEVDPTGTFDDKTATAIIDFKTKHGITQSYVLADGTPAVNEYVDEATAAALVAALKAGEHAGDAPKPAEPGDKPAETEKPAETDKPAAETPAEEPSEADKPVAELPASQPTYTVTAADRAAGLSGIARRYLGDSRRWKEIYDLNKDAIGNNPNLIVPGQKLVLPAGAKGVPGAEASKPEPKPATKPETKPETKPAVEPKPQPAPATESASGLSDEQVAQLAKDYGLKATRANVEAFSVEVNSYRESAIGPDAGDADTIAKLQAVLAKLGFKVAQSGTFDEETTQAVIDFKVKHGLHQSYKLANGDFAINEYVDEDTAQAMANAISGIR